MTTTIFANGDSPEPERARRWLESASMIIAANGGSHHCLALGYVPDFLIGDLDSVQESVRQAIEAKGGEIQQHPRRKDANDLELALAFALEGGSEDVVILGAVGGRWDQSLTNWLLLAHPEFKAMRIRVVDGAQTGQLVRPERPLFIQGKVGDTVSLIPIMGDAQGVSTAGLEYPLRSETLAFASSRGLSNRLVMTEAEVSLSSGLLLSLHLQGPVLHEEV